MTFTYFKFPFEPPALNQSLIESLRKMRIKDLDDYLRIESKKEWADAFKKSLPLGIFALCVFGLLVCVTLFEIKGFLDHIAPYLGLGLIGLVICTIVSAAHLYDFQVKRRKWFRKTKRDIDKKHGVT